MNTRINKRIAREQKAWSGSDSLSYYHTHRHKASDLYPSEKFFLPKILRQVKSVLDVGCASGGFARIMKRFNPRIRYIGVDISPKMIVLAKKKYPQNDFLVGDGLNFPFKPNSFDLVHSSGILHLNSNYKKMIRAMWKQTRRFLLCDFRLTWGKAETGWMDVSFKNRAKNGPALPYHVLNVNALLEFLKNLKPRPRAIRAKGYMHSVSKTARLKNPNALMAFFLLEKGPKGNLLMDLALDAE